MPSFDKKGSLNFFTARSICNKEPLRYINCKTSFNHKNSIIINELNINWNEPVFLVEGFMDMLRYGGNCIPLMGSTLSEESKLLLSLIINKSKVYVCLDADAQQKQIKILNLLHSYDVECYDVDIYPFQDVGEADTGFICKKIKQASKLTGRVDILRRRIQNAK